MKLESATVEYATDAQGLTIRMKPNPFRGDLTLAIGLDFHALVESSALNLIIENDGEQVDCDLIPAMLKDGLQLISGMTRIEDLFRAPDVITARLKLDSDRRLVDELIRFVRVIHYEV